MKNTIKKAIVAATLLLSAPANPGAVVASSVEGRIWSAALCAALDATGGLAGMLDATG